ncbi:MAG: hypothetical protein ACXVE4_15690 [Solirubrobacteraceae bacterium]
MSARMVSRRWHLAVRLNVLALVWSAGLVLAALLVPVSSQATASAGVDGVTLTQSTLLEVNGARALAVVAVPSLVSVVVLWAIRARRHGARWGGPLAWVAVGVLTAEAVLGILTIGGFILPAVILLAAAVRLAPGHGDAGSDAGAGAARGEAPADLTAGS